MSSGKLLGIAGLLGAMVAAPASAATVGQWTFDDFVDVTPPYIDENDDEIDPPGGETWYDSSGNAFNFVANNNFGTFALVNDRPAVITTGGALRSAFGGASVPSTPASDMFSRGKTGELTVEFWFKYTSPPVGPAYVLSFGGGNPGTRNNEWGIYGTDAGDLKFFNYENGGTGPYPEVSAGALSADWNHIAFTIDAANSMKSYVNGELIATATSAALFGGAVSDVLKWGRGHDDGFGAHTFTIDELRISNVALLPGSGSGVNALAWNASLVPEPSMAMGVLAMAAAFGLGRGRRRLN